MKNYLDLFIDNEYPKFIDKYLTTKTLCRLKYISQFCGCDYTKIYSPLFFFSRFDHSLVVAHMTWHFTHDKKSTIAALLHDTGTPCFAHCIDYVFEDYLNQESSERDILDFIKEDEEILTYLKEDGISIKELEDLKKYPILENKSPRLCTDRLDGVLHTCYIWLHTHTLEEIKVIYDNIFILKNEDGINELGFKNYEICEKFTQMVSIYTKELQQNRNKFIMKYVSEIVKLAVQKDLITLDDLYLKKESEFVEIFQNNFPSWNKFKEAKVITTTNDKPSNFHISFQTKKRNVIPLINIDNSTKRIIEVSPSSKELYLELENYQDAKYAYIETIKEIE